MANPHIGFIGIGQMGMPMIRNLLQANFSVTGFDLNPLVAQELKNEAHFEMAASAITLTKKCDVIILMLPDSNIVDRLLWDSDDALAKAMNTKQTLIDMSSSDPVRSRTNFDRMAQLGISFIDAPVSGGVRRAKDGSLSIMIGGLAPAVESVQPIFKAMGKTLVHVGAAGAGHAVKALNNYVSASGLLAVCEALIAAEKFGIDPHLVNQVFNASTGKNNTTDVKVENFMLSGTFNSGFSLALMRKDLQTALDFITRMETPKTFADACTQTWTQAEKTLDKGADHTAMYAFTQKK
ncbi:MAG: NAD(P)-dependent oxidoreductase [Betaproteobacteria bacterium]|nr:NAD(P)-dependent oxidoreductase [Betaproteobacteria bacterium]